MSIRPIVRYRAASIDHLSQNEKRNTRSGPGKYNVSRSSHLAQSVIKQKVILRISCNPYSVIHTELVIIDSCSTWWTGVICDHWNNPWVFGNDATSLGQLRQAHARAERLNQQLKLFLIVCTSSGRCLLILALSMKLVRQSSNAHPQPRRTLNISNL